MNRVLGLLIIFISLLSCERESQESKYHRMEDPPLVLIRQPYLQCNFSDSVIVAWKTTNAATSGHIEYSIDGKTFIKKEAIVEHQTANTMSYVTIKNLKPNVKYSYRIFNNGELMSENPDNYFYSAESISNKFSFLSIADVGQPPHWNGHQDETAEQMFKIDPKPNFVLGLGDIVYPEGSSLEADRNFFDHFGQMFTNTPIYTVLGNHDYKSDIDKNFFQEWFLPGNKHYYSFDYGNAHFIGLDSGDDHGFYDEKNQFAWLEEDLVCAQDKGDWIIVFLHHTGRTCTSKAFETDVFKIYGLFAKYNVDLVLNGHAHTYERVKPLGANGNPIKELKDTELVYPEISNGFISITAGSGGRVSKSKGDFDFEACKNEYLVRAIDKLGFLSISIDGKILSSQFISSESGKVLDHFQINKNL